MKKIIIAIVVCTALSFNGISQFYQFNYFTDTYTEFNDGTLVDMIEICDENLVSVPIGFDFPIYEYTINSLQAHTVFLMEEFVHDSQNYGIQLFPLGAGYSCAMETELSYKMTGLPGDRIFKFQWKNLGIWNDMTGLDRINIQCWLYEQSGTIEYRFGFIQITQPDSYFTDLNGGFTAVVNYVAPSNPLVLDNSQYLVGAANTPTSVVLDPNTSTSMTGHPSMNKVYQFARPDLGIKELKMTSEIYPNPTNGIIQLKFTDEIPSQIEIRSVVGEIVFKIEKENINEQLNLKDFNSGLYFLQMTFTNRIETFNIIKN